MAATTPSLRPAVHSPRRLLRPDQLVPHRRPELLLVRLPARDRLDVDAAEAVADRAPVLRPAAVRLRAMDDEA